jgi:hypothetical protein
MRVRWTTDAADDLERIVTISPRVVQIPRGGSLRPSSKLSQHSTHCQTWDVPVASTALANNFHRRIARLSQGGLGVRSPLDRLGPGPRRWPCYTSSPAAAAGYADRPITTEPVERIRGKLRCDGHFTNRLKVLLYRATLQPRSAGPATELSRLVVELNR